MKTFRNLVGLLLVCCAAAPLFAADTVESVEKQVGEQFDKVKAMSAKLKMTIETDAGGMKSSTNGDGTVEFMRHGDKVKSRAEMKVSGSQGEQKFEMSSIMVCDGEFTYSYSDMMGMKSCIKDKADDALKQISPKGQFEQLRTQEFTLKLIADETIDGKPAWTIEGTPKDGTPPSMQCSKVTLNFSKENGVFLRQLAYGKDGKVAQTIAMLDIKLDPTFAPDRFEFKVPEGVTMTDKTAGAAGGATPKK